MSNNYWMDKEYIKALENYSEFNKMCRCLNEFDFSNQWAFEKRNIYLNEISFIILSKEDPVQRILGGDEFRLRNN